MMKPLRAWIDTGERLFRGSYLGYTWLLVMLGAGASSEVPTSGEIVALIVLGLNYHFFGYMHNDLIDLPLDRTQPRRAQDPLVTGQISERSAWRFVLAQIPVSLLVLWLAEASWLAFPLLVTGYAATVVYNAYGKRCPVPMLTDAVQGIAWAMLALTGAALVGEPTTLTILPAAFAFIYIVLINGIHGSLRDLDNDYHNGQTTTAIYLGARPIGRDIIGTRRLAAYAYAVFAALLAPPVILFVSGELKPGLVAITAWILINAYSLLVLSRVVSISSPDRQKSVFINQLPLLLPPVIVQWPLLDDTLAITLLVCFFLPYLIFIADLRHFADYLADYGNVDDSRNT